MGDITKAFFIARDFTGPLPFSGVNHLPLPVHPHELRLEAFRPGDGHRLQEVLTGDWPTGEKAPRKLPRALANEVAHHINVHRHAARVGETGYVLQLVAAGSPQLHWTLRKIALKGGRFDPLKGPAGPEALARHERGEAVVFKSELDNLEIDRFQRRVHYVVHVIAFDSVGDMEVWLDHYRLSTLATKDLHRAEVVQEPVPPTPWFELTNWQRLPGELIQRLDKGAHDLLFPSAAQMAGRALDAARGPLLTLPFAFMGELFREADERGPHNCVHTVFQADIRAVLSHGQV